MSVIGNPLLLGGDAGAPSFTTDRSVRLRSSNSAYFNRTPASAGNRKTWTWSGWVKRGILNSSGAVAYPLFAVTTGTTDATWFEMRFLSDALYVAGYVTNWRVTTQVFRDPSAWYHIVLAVDTTQATANDRLKLYVNGVQVTTFSTTNNPTQNTDLGVNQAVGTYIGYSNTQYFDGYLTEVNFVDGQALTPASFGEYDAVRNTQWKPKAYSGSWGTNGFYLKFADNSNNTAATIGKDSSGNSNNWTPNGISVTAGATYDSMTDVPTLTSETASNFATLNPIAGQGNGTYSDGNLAYLNGVNATWKSGVASMGVSSGKYYFEYTVTTVSSSSNFYLGVAGSTYNGFASYLGRTSNSWAFQWNGASSVKTNNDVSTTVNTAGSISVNDVIQVAIDLGTGSIWWGRNNTWVQGNPSAGTGASFTNLTETIHPAFAVYSNGGDKIAANFGQRPFAYTPPTGFKSLNTFNLPDPAVASSDDYHKIYTYTGNGGGLQVGEVQKPASLFNLDRSLRFRASNSAYLSRTLTTPTNNKIWTWSAWVKRGKASGTSAAALHLFGTGSGSTDAGTTQIYFDNENLVLSGYNTPWLKSNAVYRDPLLWYHIVVAWDNSNGTATNRAKIYVNGVEITYVTDNRASLSTTSTYGINQAVLHTIGAWSWNNGTFAQPEYYDGYLADVYFIDGQALTPTDFGAYDGNYYWTPKAYTGTYGTNGFHLEFEDFSNNTATTIGKDTSGNVNNWTPTGISVTAGVTNDSMTDVPTLTSADVANFCTLNPLAASTSTVPTQGNLYLGNNAVNNFACVATLGVSSGKWYWELKPDSNFVGVGVTPLSALPANTWTGASGSQAKAYYSSNGQKYDNGTNTAYGATWTSADLIGVALDMDAGTITFYKNGTSQGVAFTGLTGVYYPVIGGPNAYNSGYINFGQRPFQYSNFGTDRPAATFKSLNSFNVAEVTGDLESPDFVWIKSRSASGDHALFNSVTGVGKYLRSNASGAEITDVNSLIQFNKNGFLLGNATVVNASATTFVASAWKAAATTVTNTAGTITTQVRASPTAGISVVTYTGTLAGSTIGHGLGAAPRMVIIKNQGTIGTQEWLVGHASTGWGSYLLLSSPNLRVVASNRWNNTDPTSTVITLGSIPNSNTEKYVAYCFAEIDGFSKFGSYLSNNAADGPFVYTGFRPRWLMVKRAIAASGTGGWFMYDASRNTYNVMDQYMFAEGTAGDNALAVFDFTSNGFKIRSNNVHVNTTSGDTYIYMAFAEHPMKYSLAR